MYDQNRATGIPFFRRVKSKFLSVLPSGKFAYLFTLFFLVSFNYVVLWDTKNTLIVTSPQAGAEAIPFLKVWGVMPLAALVTLLYARLSITHKSSTIFYGTLSLFLAFFILFAYFLYPIKDKIHCHALADYLQLHLPVGFKGFIACIRYWTFSLFYVVAELWGSVVFSLLCWQVANETIPLEEAKRVYPLFSLGSNLALLLSGPIIIAISQYTLKFSLAPWENLLSILIGMISCTGFLMMIVYHQLRKTISRELKEPPLAPLAQPLPQTITLKAQAKQLLASRKLSGIAVLVLAYGITVNFADMIWENEIRKAYPLPNDYITFMGQVCFYTGLITLSIAIFLGSWIVQKSWRVAASIPPLVFLITGSFFFSAVLDTHFNSVPLFFGGGLQIALVLGTLRNILSRACTYSLYEPTKEILYIPLDREERMQGKACVDVFGLRLGKCLGSLTQQALLISCGGLIPSLPWLSLAFIAIALLWFKTVQWLNQEFKFS